MIWAKRGVHFLAWAAEYGPPGRAFLGELRGETAVRNDQVTLGPESEPRIAAESGQIADICRRGDKKGIDPVNSECRSEAFAACVYRSMEALDSFFRVAAVVNPAAPLLAIPLHGKVTAAVFAAQRRDERLSRHCVTYRPPHFKFEPPVPTCGARLVLKWSKLHDHARLAILFGRCW